MDEDASEEKVVAIFEKPGCNTRLNALKFAARSVKGTTQSLPSFRKGRTANRFGMSRESCEI